MPDFLNIPGNIRQQYMPFTIKGSDDMQLFTFKEKMRKHTDKGGVAIIHPFSKYLGTLIQNDSSISYTHGPDGNKKVTYEQFLDEIPSLQIREFVPDAKLTQTFKWFSYLKKGFDNAMKSLDTEAAGGWQNVKEKLELALKDLSTAMKELTSGNAKRLAKVVSGLTGFYQDRGFNVGDDDGLAVLWLPFILYYRLTTTRTNNIYEFPTSMQNNIFESDGTYGWGDDNGTDFPLLDVLGDKARSIVGLASSGLASTIRVNAMPAFSPTGSAAATSFDVHIDLINDSEEAAINNFLFCHTLFGNNRWLQYGFVQTGASLYDVKFPGANRFFMCKGKFVCKGKGAFRTPSQNVIDGIVSHKHNTKTADQALGVPDIQESLGIARAREQLQAMGDSSSERAVSISSAKNMVSQIVTNAVNTQTASINTKNPNAPVALSNKSSTASMSLTDIGQKYSQNVKTIKENQASIITAKSEIEQIKANAENQKQTYIGECRSDYETKRQEAINAYNADSFKFPDYTSAEDYADNGDVYTSVAKTTLDKAISGEAQKIKDIESQANEAISEQQTAIDTAQKAIDSAKQSNSELESTDQFKTLSKNLGAEAVKNTVVTVTPETWKNLIKIPDVYSLTLTFSSLIPDNFNNYLYGWRAGNLDPIDNYFLGEVIEKGVMEKLVDNLIEAVGKG